MYNLIDHDQKPNPRTLTLDQDSTSAAVFLVEHELYGGRTQAGILSPDGLLMQIQVSNAATN